MNELNPVIVGKEVRASSLRTAPSPTRHARGPKSGGGAPARFAAIHSDADGMAPCEGRDSEACRKATARVLLPNGRFGFWLVLVLSSWAAVAIVTIAAPR